MLEQGINTLVSGKNLTALQSEALFSTLIDPQHKIKLSAVLALLTAKGETADEIVGTVRAIKKQMISVTIKQPVLDIVGTGGDGANTVNISTAASLVAACCGVNVVKHGNRSVSSQCGSADVLEALGVSIHRSPTEVIDSVNRHQFGFCYAPDYHPAFLKVKSIRHQLGFRSVFNLIGPLLNPANAQYLLLGVSDKKYLSVMAEVLQQLSISKAMVVHSQGLDELSLLGTNDCVLVADNNITHFQLDPRQYGFNCSRLDDIKGGDKSLNAKILTEVFQGAQNAIADTIALNAAAALYIANRVNSIQEGIVLAKQQLKNGTVTQKLMALTERVND